MFLRMFFNNGKLITFTVLTRYDPGEGGGGVTMMTYTGRFRTKGGVSFLGFKYMKG